MITFEEVLTLVQPLEAQELELWIERQWVRPERSGESLHFAEVDVARIRLIHDIRHTMEVPSDTVPVVLSLIDQLYSTRRQMRSVMRAIDLLPPEARDTILATLDPASDAKGTEGR